MRRLARAVVIGLALLGAIACETPEPPRGVVLVVVDTARADHFSSYGYARLTTPQFDRLAEEGERYDEAYSPAPWTLPSMASILTGQPPHAHGAGRGVDGMFGIRDRVRTLADRMTAAGFRTAAFINVIWCSPKLSSLDRGFELYDFRTTDSSNRGQRDARETTDAALAWLADLGDEPFFMVVHYFDPHLTYDPPAPYDTMFDTGPGAGALRPGFGSAAEVFKIRDRSIHLDGPTRESLIARYDGELRFTDEQFGRLRKGLEESGRWDDSLVIVLSDHGEEFWDHGGFEHGHSHHRELLRVPLIVRRPGGPRGAIRSARVRQIDIAPTVLEFAGLPLPVELPGSVLGDAGAPYAVAEGSLWGGDLVSIRSDDGTLIMDRTTGEARAFAADDPSEHRALDDGALHEALLPLLQALPGLRSQDDSPRALTDEQREQLRSLGYLQ